MVVVMIRMFILVIAICSSSTVAATASGASGGGSGRRRMGLPIPKVLPLQHQHQIHSEMAASTSTQKKKSPRNWLWGQPSNDDDENDEKQEQEDSETNPDESKNGKSSWKESRKPVQESHPSTKKQGFTRFSIPMFGGMKNNNNTKTNDDDIDSDSSSNTTTTTTTTPVNNRQLERARRKQEREERVERQKVEKEETIKARKSMFERAKAARKEKNRNNNNNTTTTLDDNNNNNKTVITLDESNETETSSLANTTAEDEDDNIKGSSTSANINNGAPPNTIFYSYPQERPRPTMVYRSMPQRHQQSSSSSSSMGTTPQGMSPQQALVVTAVASLLSLVSRIWIVMWITKQLGWEEDMIDPVQHFVWECLNDRYVKDEKVLTRALQRAPSGYNKFQWWRHLKSLRSSNSSRTFVSEYDDNNPKKRILPLKTPARTTVVVNITPNEQLDLSYLSDVVNFLTRVHQSYGFGKDVEVILLLESGGGSVATFGLAASQIARLEHAGMNTTVCVDNIAASGGYMIASQSAQIVIAPFAVVGSIGVQTEFLNFNK
eukprot:scaffold9983_cov66-Cylindrotheca_fusiformis.AAC.1